jgi:uncharacterized protein (TIGR00369 family)
MSAMTKAGQQILATQPFSLDLGVELVKLEEGKAELRLELEERHTQHLGFAHGGVVSTMADMGLAFAGGPMMGPKAVTAEFKINFIRPAVGEALIARGEVISSGKSQTVVRCEIFAVKDGGEKLCAAAQGTIAAVSGGSRDA